VEEAVANWLAWDQLPLVIDLAAELRDSSVTPLLQQVGQCVGRPGTSALDGLKDQLDESSVRTALAAAMQASGNAWFKTVDGGESLGRLLLDLGLAPEIDRHLHLFWQRVRQESGWV
jgi:hypothetical protein